MRKFFYILAAAALFYVVSCASPADPPTALNAEAAQSKAAQEDNAPRITLADAKKDFDAGDVVIIDVRDETVYKTEHIKGSINLPLATFEARFNEIPKEKKIIAYCS
jgi:predicted sulfurtransferase